MQHILTQSLLPAKGSVQQTGSNRDVETAKSAAHNMPHTAEKSLSFTTILADFTDASGEESISTDLPLEQGPPTAGPAQNATLKTDKADVTETEQPPPNAVISTAQPSGADEGPRDAAKAAMPVQPLAQTTNDPSEIAVPAFETRRTIERTQPKAIPLGEPPETGNSTIAQTPSQSSGTITSTNARPITVPFSGQAILQPDQTRFALPSNASKPWSLAIHPTALSDASGEMPRDFPVVSHSSNPEGAVRVAATTPVPTTATLRTKAPDIIVPTNQITTDANQADQAQTRTETSNATVTISNTLSATSQMPVMAQLATSTVPLVDPASRRSAADRTGAADPAVATFTAAKPATPLSPLQTSTTFNVVQAGAAPMMDTAKNAVIPAEADPLVTLRGDVSIAATAPQNQPVHPTLSLPQHVARQIAEAMQNMPNRPVEISLNPEELGRVRLALTASETGLVVNVLAERQETVDLMRRHIANLESAFQDIGYNHIAFSFTGGNQSQTEAGDDSAPTKNMTDGMEFDASTPNATQITLTAGPSAGLDIRL
ncbi:flagellar hook-length control protein FliK [Sulfitobacter geojensis]|uniref:flagellar hook-length control protein FliK n=1 Tax=Sulfitobacter geojensis TaxID=1342299 RepID=UPI00248F8AEF|nr:flagellar hook-length control protein FliK [Sulfitobacter geojensis]